MRKGKRRRRGGRKNEYGQGGELGGEREAVALAASTFYSQVSRKQWSYHRSLK